MFVNTSGSFFKRLAEKEQQKAEVLYAPQNKENKHRQQHSHNQTRKERRTKTQHSVMVSRPRNEKLVFLDLTQMAQDNSMDKKVYNNWVYLPQGIVEFTKIMKKGQVFKEVQTIMKKNQMQTEGIMKSSIVIELIVSNENKKLISIFMEYALQFITFGKGTWSLAAFTEHKCYDLLSFNTQGQTWSKNNINLSKVQLEKEQLMKRVFGFSSQKEKELQSHELLGKLQLSSNNIVYLKVRNVEQPSQPLAEKLIQQDVLTERINNRCTISLVRPNSQVFEKDAIFINFMKRSGLKIKREEELSRPQREVFLKLVIQKLEGELTGKQEQLNLYRSLEGPSEQQLGIPSERIHMGKERYSHLNRRIKEAKIL